MPEAPATVIAVDIGNSRIKLGRFDGVEHGRAADHWSQSASPLLPEPTATLEFALADHSGSFDLQPLADWCGQHVERSAAWLVGSVHRAATERFASAVAGFANERGADWPLRQVTYRDVPIDIQVDEPERVGIDRLLAALAANRIRRPNRAAIVVDSGSATTVDFVSAVGAFCGGAILPGIAMAARALHEQTDALPHVVLRELDQPPQPLGTSTAAAIEAGLFWGAVGAIRELVRAHSASLAAPPDVLLTGGASPLVAQQVAAGDNWNVRHEPHLVLAGIALIGNVPSASHR